MPRTKGGYTTRQRRNRTLKAAKGYWGGKHRLYRPAAEAVDKARKFATRDRRTKKRLFRNLWIVRINAAAHINGLSYGTLISGLKKAGVLINRKVLADLAVADQKAFAHLASIAREGGAAA